MTRYENTAPGLRMRRGWNRRESTLTHPDFAKLSRPEFPDQPERLPGNFPFILGPGVLWGQAHTGQGQPLA